MAAVSTANRVVDEDMSAVDEAAVTKADEAVDEAVDEAEVKLARSRKIRDRAAFTPPSIHRPGHAKAYSADVSGFLRTCPASQLAAAPVDTVFAHLPTVRQSRHYDYDHPTRGCSNDDR